MEIRYVQTADKDAWLRLDRHLPEAEFERKVRDNTGYVLLENNEVIGVLRYNLFWDIIPFCNLIFIDNHCQRAGYGRKLMEFWENDMKSQGHDMIMTSTQSDETAQHFYRKLGYSDSGGLLINIPKHEQPMEIFFIKSI